MINESIKKKIKSELDELVATAAQLAQALSDEPSDIDFRLEYDNWFTKAELVILQLAPSRSEDFVSHYRAPKNRKELTAQTYTVSDYLLGLSVTDWSGVDQFDIKLATGSRIFAQLTILRSVQPAMDSVLANLRDTLLAELFDNELEKAKALLVNGFLREAGNLAGVVLDEYLQEELLNNTVKLTKKKPTLGDMNDALKNANVFETTKWRKIQGLIDIRNLCDHKKMREPRTDDISDLIVGVSKLIKS